MTNVTCKNCGNNFLGRYCNQCGEKIFQEKDKKLKNIFEEAFHFLTHFEGKFFNSFRTIITRPGKLSFDYCSGIRKKYFKPISFFLMLVIIYLLFPVFEGLNMKMYYHTQHGFYGDYAAAEVARVMEAKGWSEEYLSDVYQAKGEKTSKFLLFIILPLMAFFSWLVGMRKRRYYFDHFIFTTEIVSFFILWGFLLLPLLLIIARILRLNVQVSDDQTGIAMISVFIIYLSLAARRFFKYNWLQAGAYTILFSVIMIAFIQNVYKFILFYIAIHLV